MRLDLRGFLLFAILLAAPGQAWGQGGSGGLGGGGGMGGLGMGTGGMMGGPADGGGYPGSFPGAASYGQRLAPLSQILRNSVSPTSWDKVGGPGTIDAVDDWGVLIISQTTEVHQDIENLLSALRKAKSQSPTRQPGVPGVASKRPSLGPASDSNPAVPAPVIVANQQADASIRRALDDSTVMEFVDTPISDIVSYLSESHDVPILIDKKALEEAAISPDVLATMNVRNVSLRSGLKLLLKPLDLTYTIRDEVLQITTPESACSVLTTRIYPVTDLAIPARP